MAIQVTKKIKLNLTGIPTSDRAAAKEEVAEFLEDTILDHLSRGESPVSGEAKAFKPLSKGYKKIKAKISGSSKPSMELFGDMLDDFDVKVQGNQISAGFHGDASEDSRLKAENHNKFTSRSQKTSVPKRRFIPKGEDGKFRKAIMSDIEEILQTYREDDAN